MTYDEIKKNKEVCECLKKGNENLGVLGFTDNSAAHCTMVAKRAAYIIKKIGYSESEIEKIKNKLLFLAQEDKNFMQQILAAVKQGR